MKLEWENALPLIEDAVKFLDGNGEKWCKVMWMLIDKHKQNTYHSFAEKLGVYSRLNGIVKLFYDFNSINFEYSNDENYFLDYDISSEIDEFLPYDDDLNICDELIRNIISSDCLSGISSLLATEFNTATLYSMLKYFLCGYEDNNENDDKETDEISAIEEFENWFNDCSRTRNIIDYYCNEATFSNVKLYQWVEEILQK